MKLYAAYVGSLSIGPITNIILFKIWGNSWHMNELTKITYFALAIGLLMPFFIFKVSDDYILKD